MAARGLEMPPAAPDTPAARSEPEVADPAAETAVTPTPVAAPVVAEPESPPGPSVEYPSADVPAGGEDAPAGMPSGIDAGSGEGPAGMPSGIDAGSEGAPAGMPSGVEAGSGEAPAGRPSGIDAGSEGAPAGIPSGIEAGSGEGPAGRPSGIYAGAEEAPAGTPGPPSSEPLVASAAADAPIEVDAGPRKRTGIAEWLSAATSLLSTTGTHPRVEAPDSPTTDDAPDALPSAEPAEDEAADSGADRAVARSAGPASAPSHTTGDAGPGPAVDAALAGAGPGAHALPDADAVASAPAHTGMDADSRLETDTAAGLSADAGAGVDTVPDDGAAPEVPDDLSDRVFDHPDADVVPVGESRGGLHGEAEPDVDAGSEAHAAVPPGTGPVPDADAVAVVDADVVPDADVRPEAEVAAGDRDAGADDDDAEVGAGPGTEALAPTAASPRTIVIDDLDDESYEPAHMATPAPDPAQPAATARHAAGAAGPAAGVTGRRGGTGSERPAIAIRDLDEPADDRSVGRAAAAGLAAGAAGTGVGVAAPSGEQAAARERTGGRHAARTGAAGGSPPLIRPIGPSGRRRPTPLLIGAVLLALVLVVLAVRALAGGDDGEGETGPGTTQNADTTAPPNDGESVVGGGDGETATDDTVATDDTTATDDAATDDPGDAGDDPGTTATTAAETTTTARETTTTSGQAGVVPPGWTEYTGGGGRYTIAHPADWRVVQVAETRIQFRHPDNGTYLMVDWTDDPQPDPVADWQNQSQYFAARHENYETIRIEPFPYRDYNAAIWEFRYSAGGADLHVANLGFVVGGERAFALYFQTREANWASSQPLYEQFRLAFQPG
jgi:hypothetical protein